MENRAGNEKEGKEMRIRKGTIEHKRFLVPRANVKRDIRKVEVHR